MITQECTELCEAQPICKVCGLPKPPIGRSVSVAAANGYCNQTRECPGYMQHPKPGHLWPGELKEWKEQQAEGESDGS